MRIARIHGVDLKLHGSLVVLLAYVVAVTSSQFPALAQEAGLYPSDIHGGPIVWGLVLGIGLLASVAVHEFAHVLIAQRLGGHVRGVTLMMLGGVSEVEGVPEVPYGELRLAIVGPVMSFVLGGVFFALRGASSLPEALLAFTWLGRLNLMLGAFNLLPAFPLDGGRALRSILAARQGRVEATRNAVRVRRVLAWLLGLAGVMQFNVILFLIAVFVYIAAGAELEATERRPKEHEAENHEEESEGERETRPPRKAA